MVLAFGFVVVTFLFFFFCDIIFSYRKFDKMVEPFFKTLRYNACTEESKRYTKNCTWTTRVLIVVIVVLYMYSVYNGKLQEPQIVDLVRYNYKQMNELHLMLSFPKEHETYIKMQNKTMQKYQALKECKTSECFQDVYGEFKVYWEYQAHMIEDVLDDEHTDDIETIVKSVNNLMKSFENYNWSAHSEEINTRMKDFMLSFVIHDVHVAPFNFENTAKTLEVVNMAYQRSIEGQKKLGSMWKTMDQIAYQIGATQPIDELRKELESFGLSTDAALVLIGLLGPDIPGQTIFIKCLIRHYIQLTSPKSVIEKDGVLVYQEEKGISTIEFIARMMTFEGLPYTILQFKMLFYAHFMDYFCVTYGLLHFVLKYICKFLDYERGERSVKWKIAKFFDILLKEYRTFLKFTIMLFLFGNAIGFVCLSYIDLQAYLFGDFSGKYVLIMRLKQMLRDVIAQINSNYIAWTYQMCFFAVLAFTSNFSTFTKNALKATVFLPSYYRNDTENNGYYYAMFFRRFARGIDGVMHVIIWLLPFLPILAKYFPSLYLMEGIFSSLGYTSAMDGGIAHIYAFLAAISSPLQSFATY
jgi:hypothetical protein